MVRALLAPTGALGLAFGWRYCCDR